MRRWLIVGSVLWAFGAVAQAQTPPAPYPVEILRQQNTVEVNADGTFTLTQEQLSHVKTQQGVQQLSVIALPFNENMQSAEIVEVYVIKADGKRIDAALDQVLTRAGAMAVNAPMFNDAKLRVLPISNLEIGDKVGMVARIQQNTPQIAGHFSLALPFSKRTPSQDVHVVVSAPKDYALNVEVVGLDNKPPTTKDGRKVWAWTYENKTPEAADPGAVAEFDTAPRIVISSLRDYAALAKAYDEKAREKTALTQEIQQLADKLTAGVNDRREQVRLLYDWVSANIRYVNISLSVGAIVPHSAAEVLANLYGDCKDHVTLLEALLKAKGIDSTGALVNAGDSFAVSKVAAMQQFNHVITYIPEMKLYLDSTARYAPFGILPFGVADKTVLLTGTGKLDRTPWIGKDSVVRTVTTLKVRADGSADAETKMSLSGSIAVGARASAASVTPDQEQAFLRQVLGNVTEASFDRGKPDANIEPHETGFRYKISNYLQVPGPGAISFSIGPRVAGRVPWATEVRARPRQQQYDFICPSGQYIEEITVELPASIKLSSVPQSQEMTVNNVKLRTNYTREGTNTLKSVRVFEALEPHRYCAAKSVSSQYADFVKMNGLLGAQALYE